MIQKTIAFLFFVISFSTHPQSNELMSRLYIANQNINNLIPNKITESKSVVLYLIDNKKTNEELKKLHQRFLKTNIDVVNYINLDDFLIDKKIKNAFVDYFKNREIKNIIIYNKIDKKEELLLSTFNNKPTLLNTKKNTVYFKEDNPFSSLQKRILEEGFEEGNFLPNPTPEPIYKINTTLGKVVSGSTPNLKKEKLAVVLFDKIDGNINEKTHPFLFNEKIDLKNETLKKLFELYENENQFVKEKDDSRFYFSRGVKYMFRLIHGRKETLENYFKVTIQGETKKGYFVLLQHSFSKNIFIKEDQKMYVNWEDAVNDFIISNN